MAILLEDECLLYEDSIHDDMIRRLSEELEFHNIRRFNFAGTANVMFALFNLHDVGFRIQKHRIIYKCEKVNPDIPFPLGEFSMAHISHLEKLILMSTAFSQEYYGKANMNEMASVVLGGIKENNLYEWIYYGQVCSLLQVNYNDFEFPLIGLFHTDAAHRGKGFGTALVHSVTKGLLEAGHEYCMLVADAQNPASNKAFVKSGYQNAGEYIRAYKNK